MKTLISALTAGIVLAFTAPAFAATGNAYVGDMLADPAAEQAPAQAENTASDRRIFKRRARERK